MLGLPGHSLVSCWHTGRRLVGRAPAVAAAHFGPKAAVLPEDCWVHIAAVLLAVGSTGEPAHAEAAQPQLEHTLPHEG